MMLAFGISSLYSKFVWYNGDLILVLKADSCVEDLPARARLMEVLNPFSKLEQGVRRGLNLLCGSLVGWFSPSLLLRGQQMMPSSQADDLVAVEGVSKIRSLSSLRAKRCSAAFHKKGSKCPNEERAGCRFWMCW